MQDLKQDTKQEKPRKSSFLATMKAVLWSFLGIRKKSGYEQDAQLNPVHVIIAAVIGFAIFITILLIIVKVVVAQ